MTSILDFEEPVPPNGKPVLTPASRADWRRWLATNPGRVEGLWVVYRKKSSSLDGPVYEDLVEEALCHGWIDSQLHRIDDERLMQWFSPRRRGGMWSSLNKQRIERLHRDGLITAAGQVVIDQAKTDGSWSRFDDVEAMVVPDDLAAALAAEPGVRDGYENLSDSEKKQLLWSVYDAKRPETRARRIVDIVTRLADDQTPSR